MAEVVYTDPANGNVVLTFDGSVVELFVGSKGSISRVHVALLHVEVKGPHRKGFYEVDFSASARGLGGFKTYVPGETWPWVAQFLETVRAATPPRP